MATESLVLQLNNFAMPGKTSVQVNTVGIEASGQSYKAGAPLVASSGKLATASEDVTTPIIVGFATKNASGVANTAVPIIPAIPGLEFEATLEDGTSGDYALTQANLYVKYGLAVVAATKFWYVDVVETSAIAVVVIELVDPIGTVQGRVRVRLLNSVCLANL